jgi:hypothetical protein
MKQAACTIVSLNYLPYARVLCDAFLSHHPGWKFYVLLVDRIPKDIDLSNESFELVSVEQLGIPDFLPIAFKYDILELNTNVKPTFMKSILASGIDQLIYLDPDIFVYRKLDSILEAMDDNAIVLTPHVLSPNQEDIQSEVILLMGGVFNLGFVGVTRCKETDRFLSWWETRCLGYGYCDPRKGMFVDQKWVNLVPCLFDSVKVLKRPGCNMAVWNLHERELSQENNEWMVNRTSPLEFYHFSGITVDGGEQLSRRKERFSLANRPDICTIYQDYRALLIQRGFREFKAIKYAFDYFDNGQYVNHLTRALYAANLEKFAGEDPFHKSGRFYAWAKASHFLGDYDSAGTYNSQTYTKNDFRLRALHWMFRLSLRILGADRYTLLLKYLSYISILSNQCNIFNDTYRVT